MRFLLAAPLALLVLVLVAAPANADLVSTVGGSIILPPSDALDDIATNTGMEAFNEAQNIFTSVAHSIDGGGTIAAGTAVSSHMIFLNSAGTAALSDLATFTFDGVILGVMSDTGGFFEAASTFELGAAATNYTVTGPGTGPAAPFPARGLESPTIGGTQVLGSDGYTVSGSSITVSMFVTEPGDWIRVITASTVPEPGTLVLLGLGIAGVAGRRRLRKA